MAPLLEEEENYIRLALLLRGVAPRAVRTYFDKEFPPTYLLSTFNKNYNTLNGLFKKRILNQAQWNLLFPKSGIPDSKTFDVTLMICVIRNLTSVSPPKYGFDHLPQQGETTPGSDLARIKWYRNKIAHHDRNTMSTGDFNTAWTDIADAVSRLGGLPMNQECQDLKLKILDQSNQEIMLEIKISQKEMKLLRQTMDIEHSTLKENLSDLQDSQSTLQTEHSIVIENLRDLNDSHSTLQTEQSSTTDTLSDLQDSQRTLQTEHSIVIENLRDLNDSHSTLQTEQSSTTDTLSELQDSQRTLQTEHSIVIENLRDLNDSLSTLQTEQSSTTDNLSDLQDSQRTLQTEHSIIIENLRDLKDSHSTLQIEHSKVTEILKDPIPWNIREQITEVLETCYKGHAEIVESLLKYKADCYLKCDGLTSLGIARRANHSNIVDLLERWDKQSI
ncbi:unnamed protein product [Mytilus edulis]|uniref:DZIP3-like HEPN domain-containing protein n=1 Tax=Mytilus edulis TaxID=6550 RepID=A0A8S3RXH1_MYTED|nr:unnamed protein product [Mytilus edulis]